MAPIPVATIITSRLLIQISDGGSPEVFAHPCMINTNRGIEFSSTTTDTLLPFCPPDDDLPGWVDRLTDSLSCSISGSGMFDSRSLLVFNDWFISGDAKRVHVRVDAPVGDQGFWNGLWILTSFSLTGAGRREKVTFDCNIQSSGEVTWVTDT